MWLLGIWKLTRRQPREEWDNSKAKGKKKGREKERLGDYHVDERYELWTLWFGGRIGIYMENSIKLSNAAQYNKLHIINENV